ncbi:MAG: hypothetical protein LQ338_001644 [Usnochroma carphineum]|nr:MAG: hypothetical protein LQ338_001644 [Usnochroma carphineum]
MFWDLYFPANERIAPRSRKIGINFCNWTVAVRRLDLNDSALRPAVLALSLARIGESNNDRPVSEQAIKLYGTALKEMNLALQDQVRVQTDEVSAAGKLMAGYEMFHGSTTPELAARGMSWRSHNDGVIKLLEMRSPRQHTTQDARILFLDTRSAAIVAAIISQFDSLQLCPDPSEQWYASLSSKILDLPSSIRPPAAGINSSESDRSFSFEESDYALVITLALYWATCNLLHSLIRMAYDYLHASGLLECSQELPQHVDPHRSATSIAHSVGYFIRPEMGILGPQLISFPVGVALMYFMGSSDPRADEERERLSGSTGRLSEVVKTLCAEARMLGPELVHTRNREMPDMLVDGMMLRTGAWVIRYPSKAIVIQLMQIDHRI